ncbi:MAG: cytoplasmic protein [Desulfobacteraceae bacterium 4572_123]|nr:MAG: cytoplasmic protein [Desulfobacteraceae bacterium 4572_123]
MNSKQISDSVHTHDFVETHQGFVGFGLDRKSDEETILYYLQKFSDDALMRELIPRLSDLELEEIFSLVTGLMKKHLSEPEYHRLFLKDNAH